MASPERPWNQCAACGERWDVDTFDCSCTRARALTPALAGLRDAVRGGRRLETELVAEDVTLVRKRGER